MTKSFKTPLIIVSILLILVAGGLGYREYYFKGKVAKIESEKNELNNIIAEKQKTLDEINLILSDTKTTVEQKESELNNLNGELKDLNKDYKELEKIIETDKELLQKYSKIYFLNENYSPKKVVALDSEYKINPDKEIKIHSQVRRLLEDLIDDAKDDDVEIRVVSGYRSFDEQMGLKTNYVTRYGTGANTFSADQGYSEHQLGTTVDLSNPTLGPSLTTTFDQSKSFAWLQENAYKYGFVLSYPKGNKYYQYEPWHWRFVGKDLARKLHRDNLNFYDMDQRDINEYLGEIFD